MIWIVLYKFVCKVKKIKESECPATLKSGIKLCSFLVVQTIMTLVIVAVAVFNHVNFSYEDHMDKEFTYGNNTIELYCYFTNRPTNRFSSDKETYVFSLEARQHDSPYVKHEYFFLGEQVYVGKDNVVFTEEPDGVRIMIVVNEKTIKNIKLYYDDMEVEEHALL